MNVQVIKNRIVRVFLYGLLSVILLLASSFLILQIPAVQSFLVNQYLARFNVDTGFPVTLKSVHLVWFDRLQIEGLTVKDPAGNKMVHAEKLLVNFRLLNLIRTHEVDVDGIFVDSADVYLTALDTSRTLNIDLFFERLRNLSGTHEPNHATPVNIGEAVIHNSTFSYNQPFYDSITNAFDYRHFQVLLDEAELQKFNVLGDTVAFRVRTLLARDLNSSLEIKQLSTSFMICQKSMSFTELDLNTGSSKIGDSLVFNFETLRDLNDFVNNVTVHAQFRNTSISPEDLALFAPQTRQLLKTVTLNGKMDGPVMNFKLHDLNLAMGNSRFQGSLEMDGLPDFYETFIVLDLKRATLHPGDFEHLLPPDALARLRTLGDVGMSGQFLGYPTDFVANGSFTSDLGRIISDINFKVNEESFEHSSYSGNLRMIDFDAGTILRDTVAFQRVSLNGKLRGRGLTIATANFSLNGNIESVGIRGYTYQNIHTDGRFAAEFFNGKINVDDPNLKFNAEGSIDLRNKANLIKLEAHIDTANFTAIGLTRDHFALKTDLNFDLQGLTLDSLTGRAWMRDIRLRYKDQDMALDTIFLTARKDQGNRYLNLHTSLVDAEVKGDFLFSDLFADMRRLVNEFYLNLKNDREELAIYYADKTPTGPDYAADFSIRMKNTDPIIALLGYDMDIGSNTQIEGRFSNGYTTILNAWSAIDTLRIGTSTYYDADLEVTASKIADSTQVLAMGYISSPHQLLAGRIPTDNLATEAIWNNNRIEFTLDLDQVSQDSRVRLEGEVEFGDSTRIHFENSTVKILDKMWRIDERNLVAGSGADWILRNLRLTNKDQQVTLDGVIATDPEETLRLEVRNFDLSGVNPIVGTDLRGLLNANISLRDIYGNTAVENDIHIHNLYTENFLIGDVTGNNIWNPEFRRFMIDFHIDRNDLRILSINGYYDPAIERPLNVKARLDNAELRIFEPLFTGVFSQINGKVNGAYTITGTLDNPVITGSARLTDSRLVVDYLKTAYSFEGTVNMSPNTIGLEDFTLRDLYRNTGHLSGTINHRNFRRMQLDLEGDFQNLQVLNTTINDNNLFYGQGYGTGDVSFRGPVSNLLITATAKTEKNTRIFIPIGETSSLEKKEYINFVDFSDSTFTKKQEQLEQRTELSGIILDLNIDVTQDAYCEIIFDARSGDIIRGRGTGDLKLQIDTKGEFNMFGPIEFSEGWYNFTIGNIINKEFEIQKGSRLAWYGDPYGATMDVTASYNQLASLAPIITDQSIASSSALRRKYPVQVVLKLEGPMLLPEISFDINATDLPASVYLPEEGGRTVLLEAEYQAFKNKLDEQELNRQVFSLVVLRRFSPPESFNTSGTAFNSLSELLSNQLSYWLTQVDENLEIDVDLGTLDEEAFNTFQLRLSYSFLGGRLRITRDGMLATQAANTSSADFAALAGDWTVDYLLTPDGKFKVKMYNRTNANPVQTNISNQYYTTTGISLQHTQSFNHLRDIWRSTRKKEEEETAPPTDDTSSGEAKEEDEIYN